jgi:hypothetical protein
MTINLIESQQRLQRKYLVSLLPSTIANLIQHRLTTNLGVLKIECRGKQEASQLRDATYRTLLYTVSSVSNEVLPFCSVRYEWRDISGCVDDWDLPLRFAQELSSVKTVSDLEILTEIEKHAQATGYPASCLSMFDSRPLFASDNVHRSCGVPKLDFLRVNSPESYFPHSELALYKERIAAARGASVKLHYVAANISDRQLCQRQVQSRLIKTSWGELARLCFITANPIPLGRCI